MNERCLCCFRQSSRILVRQRFGITTVTLVRLERLRQSKEYNNLLTLEAVEFLVEKYSFRGHLGDQVSRVLYNR